MISRLQTAHPALKLGFASAAFAGLAAFGQLGGSVVARTSFSTSRPASFSRITPPASWRLPPADAGLVQPQAGAAADGLAARPFILTGDAGNRARALTCLTQAVYYEAASEPEEGQRAVAQVVLNRVRHPLFPHSVCGVVYQGANLDTGCQFSFVCDGSMSRPRVAWAWASAQAVARGALAGRVEAAVGDATHYHADYVAPYWAPTVARVGQIGAHIFYRWAGDLGLPAAFSARYAGVERVPVVKPHAAPAVLLATGAAPADAAAALAASEPAPALRATDGRVHLVLDAEGYATGRPAFAGVATIGVAKPTAAAVSAKAPAPPPASAAKAAAPAPALTATAADGPLAATPAV